MKGKKRILFLVNHDVVIYNFRKELVERLLKEDYEVIISSPSGERIKLLQDMGCKYVESSVDRHGRNPFAELKLYLHYRRLIRRIHPSAVLTYTIKPSIYGSIAAEKSKTPCIVNITGLGIALEQEGLLQKILIAVYKRSLRKVQCVFFQNKSNSDFFEQHGIICKKKVLLPGSGVNIKEFVFEKYPDYPREQTKFLFVGRVMKDKGVDEYLKAAYKIKKIYPNVEFGMAGFMDGQYQGVLKNYQENNIIQYYGQQFDIRPFYKRASAVVLPSYHEGMANVLLEAAATGRPVLASDIPGCRETFEEGISGLGFKEKDADDLFEKMKKFIELPTEQKALMGKKGRKKIEQQFNRNIVVDEYMKIINKL